MQTQVDPQRDNSEGCQDPTLTNRQSKKKKKPETAKLNDTDQRDLRDIYRSFV